MSREIDKRIDPLAQESFSPRSELLGATIEMADAESEEQALLVKSLDRESGNPGHVISHGMPAESGRYVERALTYMQSINETLGLIPGPPAEYVPVSEPQETLSGAVAVHLQQRYKGVPIFQAATAVRFNSDGAIRESVGSNFTVMEGVSVDPTRSPEDAVLVAANHVAVPDADELNEIDQFGEPLQFNAIDIGGFSPRKISQFDGGSPTSSIFSKGPFEEDIRVTLTLFPISGTFRLCWAVLLSMPKFEGQYRVLVDSETLNVLYCHQTMHGVAAKGNVYPVDGSTSRQMVDFPRPINSYDLDIPNTIPAGFPEDWVAEDSTRGTAVHAHLGDSKESLRGIASGEGIVFDPADATGDEQKVLNIFYYNCVMHDFFYLLGFTEIAGNFQSENYGRGGIGGDQVDARAHSGEVWGTANMLTPEDGSKPIMNMGLVSKTGRHTAFDSTVVYHEFMHGVTNRLVGGPQNNTALEAAQSGGMGEGFGDYIACTINDVTVVGAWVTGNPDGIRKYRYNSSFPDGFGNLGTGRYTTGNVHQIGEIWCATLMELNRSIGKREALTLVIDGLKLSPANPSFLDMRDAIFTALEERLNAGQISTETDADIRSKTWAVFARFGMGPNAASNGASLTEIVADSSVLP